MSDDVSREDGYGEGALDVAGLMRLVVENVELAGGGDVGSVRARVESLWLELLYAASPDERV